MLLSPVARVTPSEESKRYIIPQKRASREVPMPPITILKCPEPMLSTSSQMDIDSRVPEVLKLRVHPVIPHEPKGSKNQAYMKLPVPQVIPKKPFVESSTPSKMDVDPKDDLSNSKEEASKKDLVITPDKQNDKDMLLGQPWILSHSVHIDYIHGMGMEIQTWNQEKALIKIKLSIPDAPRNEFPAVAHRIMTARIDLWQVKPSYELWLETAPEFPV